MKFITTFEIRLRKITYIFVAFLYLVLAVKLKTSIHFCGGNLSSISFFEQAKDTGCECEEMAQNSCCNDITFQFQTSESEVNIQKSITTQILYASFDHVTHSEEPIKSNVYFIKLPVKKSLNLFSSNSLLVLSTILLRI